MGYLEKKRLYEVEYFFGSLVWQCLVKWCLFQKPAVKTFRMLEISPSKSCNSGPSLGKTHRFWRFPRIYRINYSYKESSSRILSQPVAERREFYRFYTTWLHTYVASYKKKSRISKNQPRINLVFEQPKAKNEQNLTIFHEVNANLRNQLQKIAYFKKLVDKNAYFGDLSRKRATFTGFRQNNCLFMQPIGKKNQPWQKGEFCRYNRIFTATRHKKNS